MSRTSIQLFIGAVALALIVSGNTNAVRKGVGLENLSWLAGQWSNDTLTVFYTDHEHGAMLGVAKPVSKQARKQGGRAHANQNSRNSKNWDRIERFSADKNGVKLITFVRGEVEGEYVGVLSHRTSVTFESSTDNDQGEFPLRIIYRVLLPDTLQVIVEEMTEVREGGDLSSDTTKYTRSTE